MSQTALFPAPPAVTVPRHSTGELFSAQMFTVLESSYGPYVGLPVRSVWTERSEHLFSRETAEQIVKDLHEDECHMYGEFAEDGTLTFEWTIENDGVGGRKVITPDPWGRYLIGDLWEWEDWRDEPEVQSDVQRLIARGAEEYRGADRSPLLPPLEGAYYSMGRMEAHRITLHMDDTPEFAMRAALAPYGITADTDDDCGNSWLHIPLAQVDGGDENGLYLTADVLVDGADEVFVDELVGARRADWQVSVVSAGKWAETLLTVPYRETERVAAYIADYLTRP
jgi:hypothetical protein